MLLDVNPTTYSSSPSGLVAIGSMTYFSADDGIHGPELWKSDGTAAGTTLVADINPGPAGSFPSHLTNANGTLFFAANDGTHGEQLWKSDGSAGGTVLVADINPGGGGSNPTFLTNVNGTLFFAANDGVHGPQPWVLPPATASLAVTGFPTITTAGAAGSFSVTALNADGTTDTNYTGTVHFTSSDPQAVLPADYTFTTADAGVHTFSGVVLKTAGTQSLTATDTVTATDTGTEAGITVNPAAASQFLISAPTSVTAGLPFSLTVTVEDAYGNVVSGYTGTVHFTSRDGRATLPRDYTFNAADKGVHSFTGLVLRRKGKQSITITDTLNSALTGSVIETVL
jgi:ELWxxDGT repeat protein